MMYIGLHTNLTGATVLAVDEHGSWVKPGHRYFITIDNIEDEAKEEALCCDLCSRLAVWELESSVGGSVIYCQACAVMTIRMEVAVGGAFAWPDMVS